MKLCFGNLFSVASGTGAQIEQAMTTRRDAVNARMMTTPAPPLGHLNLAVQSESGLCALALMRLQHFGMASLADWVAKESAALNSKPALHK
jgi:hypothetical protein